MLQIFFTNIIFGYKGDNNSSTYHKKMCNNHSDRCITQNGGKPYTQQMECYNCWTRCKTGSLDRIVFAQFNKNLNLDLI